MSLQLNLSRKIKGYATSALWVAAFASFIGLAVYMEIGVWTECRETNSFWYCMRVLSK
jgi:hypothetical protein